MVGGLRCCGCHRGRRNRLLERCTDAVLGDRHLDAVADGAQPNVAGLGNRPVRKESRWSNGWFFEAYRGWTRTPVAIAPIPLGRIACGERLLAFGLVAWRIGGGHNDEFA